MNKLGCAFVAAAAFLGAPAHAAAYFISVQGTDQPWLWSDTLNSSYQFGTVDSLVGATGPAVFDLSSHGFAEGAPIYINYISGLTDSFGVGVPIVDHSGYVGGIFKDDVLGSSGGPLPSFYIPFDWGTSVDTGLFLNALIATSTDDSGSIINQPFALGAVVDLGDLDSDPSTPDALGYVGGVSFAVPVGATKLSFGINDDVFSDNSGALLICISDDDSCGRTMPPAVPEPSSWALMIAGFGLIGGALRQRGDRRTVRFS